MWLAYNVQITLTIAVDGSSDYFLGLTTLLQFLYLVEASYLAWNMADMRAGIWRVLIVSQTAYVVVQLNDSLLYTSYYGSVPSYGLKVNYELPLSSIKVSIPRAEDYGNEFSIISVKRSFTLSARYVKIMASG